jgi:hypothetical protein
LLIAIALPELIRYLYSACWLFQITAGRFDMKKNITLIASITCAIALFVSGCSNDNTATVRIDLGGASHAKASQPWYNSLVNILTLSKPAYAAAPSGITAIWAEVSADDLAPMTVYAKPTDDFIEIPNVPAGKNRMFSVVASGMSPQTEAFSTRAFGGTTTVNLKAGENRDLDILMGDLPQIINASYCSVNNSNQVIYVSWNSVFTGATHYLLYRKDSGVGKYYPVADVPDVSGSGNYNDAGPAYSTRIYYKVVPVNDYGEGESVEFYYDYDPAHVT